MRGSTLFITAALLGVVTLLVRGLVRHRRTTSTRSPFPDMASPVVASGSTAPPYAAYTPPIEVVGLGC